MEVFRKLSSSRERPASKSMVVFFPIEQRPERKTIRMAIRMELPRPCLQRQRPRRRCLRYLCMTLAAGTSVNCAQQGNHASTHAISAVNLCLRMTSFLTCETILQVWRAYQNPIILSRLVVQSYRDTIPPTTNNKGLLSSNEPKVTQTRRNFFNSSHT